MPCSTRNAFPSSRWLLYTLRLRREILAGRRSCTPRLRGPLKNKQLMEAHVTVPVLAANYKNTVQIGAAQPIHLDYVNGVATLQRTRDPRNRHAIAVAGHGAGREHSPGFHAGARHHGPAARAALRSGDRELRLVALQCEFLRSARPDPNVHGTIRIENANIATGATPVGLENGNGVITLTSTRADITSFTGTVGGGQVSAGGGRDLSARR